MTKPDIPFLPLMAWAAKEAVTLVSLGIFIATIAVWAVILG